MRSILAMLTIFLSFCASGQKQDKDCLILAFNSDSSRCGYLNSVGDTIVPCHFVHCFTDTICSFGTMMSLSGKVAAYNKSGEFLYEVYYIDNGPDYISDGMFRILENGKMGYANERGEVVIKPQYDCAFAFEAGKAQVSFDCQRKKVDEYTFWESDNWFYIDKEGNKVAAP
jgi:hypothetical protein